MRPGWVGNTRLQEIDQVADRLGGARLMAEFLVATRDDIRQLASHWLAADSTTGLTIGSDGSVRLTRTGSASIDKLTGADGFRTDLDIGDGGGDVARIRFGNFDHNKLRELVDFTIRLHPKRTGDPKTVAWWELHLWQKVVQDTLTELRELGPPVRVEATGTSETEYTFALGPGYLPLAWGDNGADLPTIFVEVRALRADGVTVADNVGWARDSTVPSAGASGDVMEGCSLLRAFSDTYDKWYWQENVHTETPILRLRFASYSGAVTIAFTGAGNLLDLDAVPTGTVEFALQGETPGGSSLTGEVRNNGDTAYIEYTDGQTSENIGVSKRETYKWQVTLSPDADNQVSPILRSGGVRELARHVFANKIRIESSGQAIDPQTFECETETAKLYVQRDGERDSLDRITELLSGFDLVDIEVRILRGLPAWLDDRTPGNEDGVLRQYAMTRAGYRVADWKDVTGELAIDLISPLDELEVRLPAYDSGSSTRERLKFPPADNDPLPTLKEAWDEILSLIGVAARFIGPGIEDDTTEVKKQIVNSTGKAELRALAAVAGGGIGEDQGRLRFIDLYGDDKPVQVVIPEENLILGDVGPGLSRRMPEYFVPFAYNWDREEFDGEYREFQSDVIAKIGQARTTADPTLWEEAAKWIPSTGGDGTSSVPYSSTLAETVAKRMTRFNAAGLIAIPFRTTVSYPQMRLGTVAAFRTNRLVARDPRTDTAIRGYTWLIGRIIADDDPDSRAFTLWVRTYSDILSDGASFQRLGIVMPEVLAVSPEGEPDGVIRAHIRTRKAKSVRVAVSTSADPSRATIQAAGVQAVNADGNYFTGTLDTLDPGETLYIGVLAYEAEDGSGGESVTVAQVRIKRVAAHAKTLRFAHGEFHQKTFSEADITHAAGYMYGAGGGLSTGVCATPMPIGVTITALRMEAYTEGVSVLDDTVVQADLYRITDSGTARVKLATVTLFGIGAGAWTTHDDTLSELVGAGDSYVVEVNMSPSSVGELAARVSWIELDYSAPSSYETY